MTHPIRAVYVDGAGNAPAKSSIRTYTEARTPLVLATAAEITTMDVGGSVAVVLSGRLYYYDSTDTSSGHDGVNVLVDSTGRRFKLQTALQIQSGIWRIADKDLSAPPGSPVDGTAYIVAAGASGAWAGQSTKIALRVAGTWAFSTPLAGAQAWVIDENTYYSFSGTAWGAGLPGQIGAGAVKLSNMANGVPLLVVEGTANTPAISTNGTAYIVGASPSGAFSGFAPKALAVRESGAWVAYAPATGWRVDDNSTGRMLRYSGTAWVDGSGSGKLRGYWLITGVGNTTAPGAFVQIATQAVAIQNAGNKLLMTVHTLSGSAHNCRIRRDSEGSALITVGPFNVFSFNYELAPADIASHTYRIEVEAPITFAVTIYATILEVAP